ncbi:unnamed protein product [Cochlearia groenlandica]
MVKKGGGTKRKISIEKITNKEALSVSYSKRTYGLHSKASQLCLLSDAQIAIFATPPSSDSNASFFSFGHSSVETLVNAYLTGQRPVPLSENIDTREDVGVCMSRMNLGLGFWWDDEKLDSSENPQELMDAIDSMAKLLKRVKKLNQRDLLCNHQDEELGAHAPQEQDQALDFKFDSCVSDKKETEFFALDDYLPQDLSGFVNNDQDFFNNEEELNNKDVVLYKGSQEQDQALNFGSNSDMVVLSDALPSDFNNISEEQAQIFAVCQSFCDTENSDSYMSGLTAEKYLGGECSNEEMDIEQLIDYDMTHDEVIALESSLEGFEISEEEFIGGSANHLMMNNEERAFLFHNCATDLVQDDDATFSNFFNEFTSLIH